jgi:GR25 family glycosyltransferase involved in LPS biosynthesis
MNSIDHVFYINLDRRKDRKEHIEKNVLPFIGIPTKKIYRFPAVDMTKEPSRSKRGAGCSLSHLKCWQIAEKNNYEVIMMIEDDFELIVEQDEFAETLKKLFDQLPNFVICNLGYNNIAPLREIKNKDFFRCDQIQTTSCYIAKVSFLKEITPTIKEATGRLLRGESYHKNAIDQIWKQFQTNEGWVVSKRLGKQQNSYSDIEKTKMEYGV